MPNMVHIITEPTRRPAAAAAPLPPLPERPLVSIVTPSFNQAQFLRASIPAQAVAISTQSSLASLPAMLTGVRALGTGERTADVVLPIAVALFRATGRPISQWQQETPRHRFPFRVLRLVLAPADRAVLHERIARRFDQMLAEGFLDEMRRLRADPRLHPDLPSMRAVGYRQAWRHLDGLTDAGSFRDEAIAATRQLAKRQLTWLRGQQDARWLDPGRDQAELEQALAAFIARP